MSKLIAKYFARNILVNLIDLPISFCLSIILFKPPSTSLFLEPLLAIPMIALFVIPIISLVVSLISTVSLAFLDNKIKIREKILVVFINSLIPLILSIWIYPPYLAKINEEKQKEAKYKQETTRVQNEEIEYFKKNGVKTINCHDYFLDNATEILSPYQYIKKPGIYIECDIHAINYTNFNIQSSVQQYDPSGNKLNTPNYDLRINDLHGLSKPIGGGGTELSHGGYFQIAPSEGKPEAWGSTPNRLFLGIEPPFPSSYNIINFYISEVTVSNIPDSNEVVKGYTNTIEYKTKLYNIPK